MEGVTGVVLKSEIDDTNKPDLQDCSPRSVQNKKLDRMERDGVRGMKIEIEVEPMEESELGIIPTEINDTTEASVNVMMQDHDYTKRPGTEEEHISFIKYAFDDKVNTYMYEELKDFSKIQANNIYKNIDPQPGNNTNRDNALEEIKISNKNIFINNVARIENKSHFHCQICQRQFETLHELKIHSHSEHSHALFLCEIFLRVNGDPVSIITCTSKHHFKTKMTIFVKPPSYSVIFKCPKCSCWHKSFDLLRFHLKMSHFINDLPLTRIPLDEMAICRGCLRLFLPLVSMKWYNQCAQHERRVTINECPVSMKQKSMVKKFYNEDSKNESDDDELYYEEEVIACSCCPSAFYEFEDFQSHWFSTHKDADNYVSMKPVCPLCKIEVFSNSEVRTHVVEHHKKIIRYHCVFCSAGFAGIKILLNHIIDNKIDCSEASQCTCGETITNKCKRLWHDNIICKYKKNDYKYERASSTNISSGEEIVKLYTEVGDNMPDSVSGSVKHENNDCEILDSAEEIVNLDSPEQLNSEDFERREKVDVEKNLQGFVIINSKPVPASDICMNKDGQLRKKPKFKTGVQKKLESNLREFKIMSNKSEYAPLKAKSEVAVKPQFMPDPEIYNLLIKRPPNSEGFKCIYCKKYFASIPSLLMHISVNELKGNCSRCGLELMSVCYKSTHARNCLQVYTITCSICNAKIADDNLYMDMHIAKHHPGKKSYFCYESLLANEAKSHKCQATWKQISTEVPIKIETSTSEEQNEASTMLDIQIDRMAEPIEEFGASTRSTPDLFTTDFSDDSNDSVQDWSANVDVANIQNNEDVVFKTSLNTSEPTNVGMVVKKDVKEEPEDDYENNVPIEIDIDIIKEELKTSVPANEAIDKSNDFTSSVKGTDTQEEIGTKKIKAKLIECSKCYKRLPSICQKHSCVRYSCPICNHCASFLKKYLKHYTNHGWLPSWCPMCKIPVKINSFVTHMQSHVAHNFNITSTVVREKVKPNHRHVKYKCLRCNEKVPFSSLFLHWENHLLFDIIPNEQSAIDNGSIANKPATIENYIDNKPTTINNRYITEESVTIDNRCIVDKPETIDKERSVKPLPIEYFPQCIVKLEVLSEELDKSLSDNDCSTEMYDIPVSQEKSSYELENEYLEPNKSTPFYDNNLRDKILTPVQLRKVIEHALTSKSRGFSMQCSCCFKMFNRRSDVQRHLVEHLFQHQLATRRDVLFKCDICGSICSGTSLKSHLQEHVNLKGYKCDICNKKFSDSSNYTKHKKFHGAKYMQCDTCQRKYLTRAMLIQHMKHHERSEPLNCPCCDKVYYFESNLKKHIKLHHLPKNRPLFKCTLCSMGFTSTKEKWNHQWMEHSIRKVEADCALCDARFRTKIDLHRHIVGCH